jgi:tetratricopeptide (TPR) repeat protein
MIMGGKMLHRFVLCSLLILATMPIAVNGQNDSPAEDTTGMSEDDLWDWLYYDSEYDTNAINQDTVYVVDIARMLIDQEQKYDSAIVLLEDYLPTDSLNSDVRYLLGFAYDQKDNLALAAEYYHQAIALDSLNWGPWRDMAYLFDIFTQYDSMNSYMRHAVELADAPESLYYDFGYSFDMLNSTDSAMIYYHKALDANSKDSDALLNLGAIWGGINIDSSYAYTRRSLDINPSEPQACYNYAVILSTLNRSPEAIDYYQKALALDPSIVAAKLQLGRLYESLGDTAMALLYYKEFVDTAPLAYLDDINQAKAKLETLK